jgi:hypothetical protein
MNSVLLQEAPVAQDVLEEIFSFPVAVTVIIEDNKASFEPDDQSKDYKIEPQSIRLFGSGGSPREFVVTFTLSPKNVEAKYRLANPALKFFQGGSKSAGIRVSPNPDEISATVSLFNTKAPGDAPSSDDFSVLWLPPGKMVARRHDPTIIWDPPGGGA